MSKIHIQGINFRKYCHFKVQKLTKAIIELVEILIAIIRKAIFYSSLLLELIYLEITMWWVLKLKNNNKLKNKIHIWYIKLKYTGAGQLPNVKILTKI